MRIISMLKRIANSALKIVNDFIPKDSKSVFLFPNEGGAVDGYNITNYNSDNVLCLANSLLKDEKYNDYKMYIVFFRDEELEECLNYCRPYHAERVHFVKFKFNYSFFKAYSRCKFVFVANDYRIQGYRSKKQQIICLNYYIGPLKQTLYCMDNIPVNKFVALLKQKNKLIDYFVTTSDFCSWYMFCENAILFSKYLSLGFPRDDMFYQQENDCKEELFKVLGFSPKHIICYTPTHRDYENPQRLLFDGSKKQRRTLFGSTKPEQDISLEQLLESSDSIIIAKAHYAQERSVIDDSFSSRIIYFSDIQKKMKISLHDILKISDVLINDYSSSFYDYLCIDKPVLFYLYDYELYCKTRGFWINPIDPLLPGPVAKSMNEFVENLGNALDGLDDYKQRRAFVRDLVDKNQDGCSAERIKSFFFE